MQRVPALDGLRGIAILLVCLRHFLGWPLVWAGVDLFFVLSGFLITSILLESKDQPGYFRNFYIKRALRILPLYYASVALLFWVVLPAVRFENPPSQWWYWLHLANWSIATGHPVGSLVAHFWSLAVEEQFYFVWPFVVAAASKRTLRHICIGIIVGAFVLRVAAIAAGVPYSYPYRLTPFRADALAFGALISVLDRRVQVKPLLSTGLALVALACWFGIEYKSTAMVTFGYSGIALVAFVAVLHCVRSRVPWLETPALQAFGKYSYCLYIVHFPVSVFLGIALEPVIPHPVLRSFANLAIGLPVSFWIARTSWRLIEEPILNLKGRWCIGSGAGRRTTTVELVRN